MKKILFTSVLSLSLFYCAAQGPSLAAGASGVIFNKGKLDAQLIAEIIATKKGEIKTELAKRLILNRFRCGNVATYYYIQNVVNVLLDETNKDIISKRLLENSAELMMVYGFGEFYLRELSKRRNQLAAHELSFLNEMSRWSAHDNAAIVDSIFSVKVKAESNRDQERSFSWNQVTQKGVSASQLASMDDIRMLPIFVNKSPSYYESKAVCDNISPVHFYIDMIFEILRNNKNVRETGFFKKLTIDENTYRSISKYYRMRNESGADTDYKSEISKNITGQNNEIYNDIESRVNSIFQFYKTLQSILPQVKKSSLGIDAEMLKTIKAELKDYNISTAQESFKKYVDSLKNDLQKIIIPIENVNLPALSDDEKELITGLKHFSDKLNVNFFTDVKLLENSRFDIEEELIPKLTLLNTRTFGAYTKVLNHYTSISKIIRLRALKGLLDRFECNTCSKFFFENYKLYFEIVNIINNLNKVESYEKCFDFLMNIFTTFGSPTARKVADFVATSHDKYLVVDRAANKLTLDVESMGVNLFERFGENSSQHFGFYFSVGINYAFNFKGKTFQINTSGDSVATVPGKFSFVSEKIGVMAKLKDFNKEYSLGKRKFKPLINNIHAVGYVSGLLYQIEFLNSNDNFKMPLYGIGAGITSFNGLDLNASYAVPLENDFGHGLWNFSLDIRITEYLGAKKKR